jgi:ATP-dependent DNA helicase DinG
MDLSSLRWLDRLPKAMSEVSGELQLALAQDASTLSSQLKTALTQLARLAMDLVHVNTDGKDGSLRFAHGQLPDTLTEPVTLIHGHALALSKAIDALGAEIRQVAKDDPSRALQCSQLYAKLGALAPRLGSVVSTSSLLLEHGAQPLAKWLKVDTANQFLVVTAHASPIVPGDLLRQFLWSRVRAAVVTSASLTSCGSFDYFLEEAGLSGNPKVQTLEVSSPFDYASQGSLTVVQTRVDPKNANAYTAEMVQALMEDLTQVKRGALALFTSRAQMRSAVEAIPGFLVDIVLVQNTQSRARLLTAHTERVQAGLPSVLFGLQSFGEGLDLPGALCETVFIAKLPFAPPSEPVDDARADRRGPRTGDLLRQETGTASLRAAYAGRPAALPAGNQGAVRRPSGFRRSGCRCLCRAVSFRVPGLPFRVCAGAAFQARPGAKRPILRPLVPCQN